MDDCRGRLCAMRGQRGRTGVKKSGNEKKRTDRKAIKVIVVFGGESVRKSGNNKKEDCLFFSPGCV